MECDELLAVLERDDLLLLSDSALPSITSLVIGGPIRGSWWGHPRGGEIYHLLNELADHADALVAKLVSNKVTFVHRRLWPAVVAIGASRESWQMDGLPEAARMLLDDVEQAGELAWNDIPAYLPPDGRRAKEAVRALEARLLVHAVEVHTPAGAHAKNLQTWHVWAATAGLSQPWPSAHEAKRQLEATLDRLNACYAARGRLPWRRRPPSVSGRG